MNVDNVKTLEESWGLVFFKRSDFFSLRKQMFAFHYVIDFLWVQIFANAEFFIFYPLENVAQNSS